MQEAFLQIGRDPTRFSAARESLVGFLALMARNRAMGEIAERTGSPLGTVKTPLRGALNVIRKALQP